VLVLLVLVLLALATTSVTPILQVELKTLQRHLQNQRRRLRRPDGSRPRSFVTAVAPSHCSVTLATA